MKKETRKRIESELITAIEGVLGQYDESAISKSRKAVKLAAKTLAKKFRKSANDIERKSKSGKDKKSAARPLSRRGPAEGSISPKFARLKKASVAITPQDVTDELAANGSLNPSAQKPSQENQ